MKTHTPTEKAEAQAELRESHSRTCASLEHSKAHKTLGKCYCDCGLDSQWRLWEEIDGTCTVYPIGADPDDVAFATIKPICIVPEGTPLKLAKMIESAPELLSLLYAAVVDLEFRANYDKNNRLPKLKGQENFWMRSNIDGTTVLAQTARTAIAKIEGRQS